MNFEVFQRRRFGRPNPTEPIASLGKQGIITVNQLAYDLFGNKPSAVLLMFDTSQRVIGLRGVEDGEKDSYRLRALPSGKSFSVNARLFAEHYGIKPEKTKWFRVRPFNGKLPNTIVFSVDEPKD